MEAQAADMRRYTASLIATGTLAGAVVMLIEVLGSRMLAPYYGVSLFVWTALIVVTLAALALGYACGGWLADRYASVDAVYGLVLAAGVALLPVPALKPMAFTLAQVVGLRGGALLSATALFGPALFLLGCVTPCIVRVMLRDVATAGRTVGTLYAASAVGSIAGTGLAGFVLIPAVGVARTFIAAALLLIVVGAGYFLFARRRIAPSAALLLIAFVVPGANPREASMPDGTRVEVVESRDGDYGALAVVDYRYGALHTRELMIDGLVQGGVEVATGLSVYEYAYVLESVPLSMHRNARTALVVGLGAGVVPRRLRDAGIRTEVVDIDPAMRDIATRHFGFPADIPVHVADARAFMAGAAGRYDVMLLDVFTGDTTPAHLLTREALALMKARLAPDGVWAANLVLGVGAGDVVTGAVLRTLRAAYSRVELYPAFDPAHSDRGNVIVVAYDGPPRSPQPTLRGDVHEPVRSAVVQAISRPPLAATWRGGRLLTDDDNPLDIAGAEVKEQVRRAILETTPEAVLRGGRAGRWGT